MARYITPHFAPANNTLALMVQRGGDELVAKITFEADGVLPANLVSVIGGNTYTPYRPQPVGIRAGRTVYFVQSGCSGLSYIVVENEACNGLACSCKEARNGLACQHTADVALFEARWQEATEAEAAKIAQVAETTKQKVDAVTQAKTFIAWVLKDKAAKVTAAQSKTVKRDCVDEAMAHIRAMQAEEAARIAAQPKYTRRTEADANLASTWGSPVYDEAYYRARLERSEQFAKFRSQSHMPVQCKEMQHA